uniref:Uncharacterized protein n=1 Tax=Leersia perrieri TaxID=77586 RepID=A0A0D9WII6_9ORYZ
MYMMYVLRCAVGNTLTEERHVREAWGVVQEQADAILATTTDASAIARTEEYAVDGDHCVDESPVTTTRFRPSAWELRSVYRAIRSYAVSFLLGK